MKNSFLERLLGRRRSEKFEAKQMRVVFANDQLRVTSLGDPNQPNVFLCFTGVKQAMGGIGAEEFVGSTRLPGYSALFVSDLTKSWFNDFPPTLLVDAIAPLIDGKRVVTVGNSMGGYGAIWSSRYIPAHTAIAFAPQYSVHPDIVPEEHRWTEFRSKIREWGDTSLKYCFNNTTRYFTINGDADALHWKHFPKYENCDHILLEGSGHEPAAMLKCHDVLIDTLAMCVEGRSPFELIVAAGIPASRI